MLQPHHLVICCAGLVASWLVAKVLAPYFRGLNLQTVKCKLGLHDMANTASTMTPFHILCRSCGKVFDITH